MNEFVLGASTLAFALVGLIFLKFWRRSRDRFFLLFAFAFWIEGIARVQEAVVESLNEDIPVYYLLRLLAYLLILWAIIEKNLPRKKSS